MNECVIEGGARGRKNSKRKDPPSCLKMKLALSMNYFMSATQWKMARSLLTLIVIKYLRSFLRNLCLQTSSFGFRGVNPII